MLSLSLASPSQAGWLATLLLSITTDMVGHSFASLFLSIPPSPFLIGPVPHHTKW